MKLLTYLTIFVFIIFISCSQESENFSSSVEALKIGELDRSSGVSYSPEDADTNIDGIGSIANSIGFSNLKPRRTSPATSLFRIKLDQAEGSILGKDQGLRIFLAIPFWKSLVSGLKWSDQPEQKGIELTLNELRIFKSSETAPNKILKGNFIVRLTPGRDLTGVLPFISLQEGTYSKIELVFANKGSLFIQNQIYDITLNKTNFSIGTNAKIQAGKLTHVVLSASSGSNHSASFEQKSDKDYIFSKKDPKNIPSKNYSLNLPNLKSEAYLTDAIRNAYLRVSGATLTYADGQRIPLSVSESTFPIANLREGSVALLSSKFVPKGKVKELILHSPKIIKLSTDHSSNVVFTFPFFDQVVLPLNTEIKGDTIYETFLELVDSESIFLPFHKDFRFTNSPTIQSRGTISLNSEMELLLVQTLGPKYNILAKQSDSIVTASVNSLQSQTQFDANFGWWIGSLANLSVQSVWKGDSTLSTIPLVSAGGTVSGLKLETYGMPKISSGENAVFFLGKSVGASHYFFANGVYSKIPLSGVSSSNSNGSKIVPDETPVLALEGDTGDTDFPLFYRKDLSLSIRDTASQFDTFLTGSKLSVHFQNKAAVGNNLTPFNACDPDVLQAIQARGNRILFSSESGPLCSQNSCSHRWSCSGSSEILTSQILLLPNKNISGSASVSKISAAKALYSSIGFDSCNVGQSGCTIASANTADWFSPFYNGGDDTVLTAEKKSSIRQKYGTLSAEAQGLLTEINNFKSQATAFCNPSPCVLPAQETDAKFKPSSEETDYYTSYFTKPETASANDRAVILDYQQSNQDLYFHSHRILQQPVERYMSNAITVTQSKIATLPPEYIRENLKLLYFQILQRNKVLQELEDQLDKSYFDFVRSELNVLIQIRREMIKALGN